MGWIQLTSLDQLNEIDERSKIKPVLIFKHSTRCSISSTAMNRMNGGLENLSDKLDVYYLDLLAFRNISAEIESRYLVHHESPQVIIIKNGISVYHSSHLSIAPATILQKTADF
jgi:bacillithiol system protein YtxJ